MILKQRLAVKIVFYRWNSLQGQAGCNFIIFFSVAEFLIWARRKD